MGCTGKPGCGGPADRSGACVGATWRRDSDIASCPLAPSAGSECSREGSTEAGAQSRLSAGAPRGEPTRTRVRLGGLMEELPANRRLPTAESIPPGEVSVWGEGGRKAVWLDRRGRSPVRALGWTVESDSSRVAAPATSQRPGEGSTTPSPPYNRETARNGTDRAGRDPRTAWSQPKPWITCLGLTSAVPLATPMLTQPGP